MKITHRGLPAVVALLWVMTSTHRAAYCQPAITSSVIGGGATTAQSTNFSLQGTVGQPVAGSSSQNNTTVLSGFWHTTGSVSFPLFADVRAFLQGAYNGAGAMSTLLNSDYLPLSNPYSAPELSGLPLFYPGTESLDSLNEDVADWVVLELRSDTLSSSAVASRAALILDDGSIVDLDGQSPVRFDGIDPDDYYIVVRHLNHLAIMSSTAVARSGNSLTHDFTGSQSSAFGNNPLRQLSAGVFGMAGADYNADGQVTAPDFNAYLGATQTGATGYLRADFNRDGQVTAPDFNLFLANTIAGAIGRVPESTSVESTPTEIIPEFKKWEKRSR